MDIVGRYPPGLPIPRPETTAEIRSLPPLPDVPGVPSETVSTRSGSVSNTPSPPFVPSASRELANDRWKGLGMSHIGNRSGVYHYRKKKKQPVVSCGVICFYDDGSYSARVMNGKRTAKNTNVLLVRRKDSMAYVEFIRGKYKPSDPLYVRSLIRAMTQEEHARIMRSSFYDLWTSMWVTKSVKSHRQEFEKSMRRFEESIGDIREYIGTLTDVSRDPEWTFPKGRLQKGESYYKCALREFEEETGIPKTRLRIFSDHPLKEVYTGTNGIVYETNLFLATVDVESPCIDPTNPAQVSEVSDVRWIPVDEAFTKMRSLYPSKEMVLREGIEQFLMKS